VAVLWILIFGFSYGVYLKQRDINLLHARIGIAQDKLATAKVASQLKPVVTEKIEKTSESSQ